MNELWCCIHLFVQFNFLGQCVQLSALFLHYQQPSAHTGDLFGVEYLFDQSMESFCPTQDELDSMIDEGFEEEKDVTSELVD